MNIKKRLTIIIGLTYLLTIVFHIALQLNGGAANEVNFGLLGVAMVLPFVVVLFVQKVLFKESLFHTFGLSFKLNRWFLVAILLPILMALILYFAYPRTSEFLVADFFTLLIIGLTLASISALFGEVVWRGYLFHYTKEFSFYQSMIFVAIVWAVWHLPVALLYKYVDSPIGASLFIIHLFFLSIIISIIRTKAKSVIAAAIVHGMLNALYLSHELFGAGNAFLLESVQIGITVVIVGVLLVVTKPVGRGIKEDG